ncbi:SLAM family member 9-like [Anolis sagrei]|uniref:SLAM family member 9-like n=1 Tax=Anolis sagrei TaxID=38937 RepID=UPI003522B9A7
MQTLRSPWLPLWLAFVAGGSFGEEDENVENVTGTLGESVALQLEFPSPFEIITWQRTKGKVFDTVGVLKPGEKCLSIITLPSLQGRLNVSEDCKKIEILRLQQEDSATFKAQVQIPQKKELLIFLFRLQVFRRLLDSDVEIHCRAIGNETWRLDCSAGESEEGVTFQMVANGQKEHSGRTLDVHDGRGKGENLNISCTARNPISTASSTRPLRALCESHETVATTKPSLNNGKEGRRNVILGVLIPIVLIVIAVCGVVLCCHSRRKKASSGLGASPAEPEECKSIYAQVGEVFQDQDVQSSRPRTAPQKKKPQASQTIYTTVEHPPKTNLLQTDDEKMGKGRRREEGAEKTVYSEITKSSESEDQSLKTVYETVKNPQPPKMQEII